MKRLVLTLILISLGVILATQAADGAALEVGDPAPAFELPGSDGKTYSLEGLRGKTVVVAWFPKAFTGG
jgi:peroxiredoxin Q/BCP